METNKTILEQANAAITRGDHEGFLVHCTEDTVWEFVGERVLRGKDEVRRYMAEVYRTPPQFRVAQMLAGEDHVTAIGTISLPDEKGVWTDYAYCDVWRFAQGKMTALQAFVVQV